MEPRELLIAVDFAPPSVAAAVWAVRHLAPGARHTLVHCIERDPDGVPAAPLPGLPSRDDLLAEARRSAAERFAALVAELGLGAPRCETLIGTPAARISTLAREEGADLVVVGDHESHGERWRPLGSTAEQLIAACDRPVLLARRPPEGPPTTVLAAVDDSELGAKALGWALRLGERHGTRVIAFHAVTDWYLRQVRRTAGEERAREVQASVEARARRWLEDFVARYDRENRVAEIAVSSGRPGEACLAAIERYGAELAVVGSHGVDSLVGDPRARLSRFLLHAAPCSVLLVT